MKLLKARFTKYKDINYVNVSFVGAGILFPTIAKTKKKALKDVKKQLHKMVDEL